MFSDFIQVLCLSIGRAGTLKLIIKCDDLAGHTGHLCGANISTKLTFHWPTQPLLVHALHTQVRVEFLKTLLEISKQCQWNHIFTRFTLGHVTLFGQTTNTESLCMFAPLLFLLPLEVIDV